MNLRLFFLFFLIKSYIALRIESVFQIDKEKVRNFNTSSMTKFGDLINVEIPVLIDFYTQWSSEEEETTGVVLKDVVAALGDKAKVIKIDIKKNEILASALKVKSNPTFVIYKNGTMKWRQSGEQDANTLISLVEQFV